MIRESRRSIEVCLLSLVLAARSSGEEPGASPGGEAREEPAGSLSLGIWKGGIGNGFRRGALHAGLSFGGGLGAQAAGDDERHDVVDGTLDFGWVFGKVLAEGTIFRGNLEAFGELFGGFQTHPRTRHFVGLTPFIQYDLATGSRWVPFVNGGAGLSETDIRGPDLTGDFQFNLQAGAGTHLFLSEGLALTGQFRYLHISNAHIREPNQGMNTLMVLLGLTWFF